jgi:hypothetical protein
MLPTALSSTNCFNFYSNSFLYENRSTVGMLSNLIVTRNEIISMLNTGYAKDTEVRSGLGFLFVFSTGFSYWLINKPLYSAWFVILLIATKGPHRCCGTNTRLVLTSKWPSVCTVSRYLLELCRN